jgi:Intron-binding protein aquarius N-terminus
VCSLYNEELLKGENHRLQLLELSGYLENYLWKHLSEDCCFEHIFSILMMVNEKFREGVPVFEALTADATKFQIRCSNVREVSSTPMRSRKRAARASIHHLRTFSCEYLS